MFLQRYIVIFLNLLARLNCPLYSSGGGISLVVAPYARVLLPCVVAAPRTIDILIDNRFRNTSQVIRRTSGITNRLHYIYASQLQLADSLTSPFPL